MNSTEPSAALGSWGGYAEGDPTAVGIVVAAVAALAIVYVVVRLLRRDRSGRGKPKRSRKVR